LRNEFTGVLTGKGINWGGSLIRPQATGMELFTLHRKCLKTKGQDFEGKVCAVSGFGNVAWGAVQKINQLGGKVVTISGPDGFVYDKNGVKGEKVDYMLKLRSSANDRVKDYAEEFKVEFLPREKTLGSES